MATPRIGTIWTWPDPLHGDPGGSFGSQAADLWGPVFNKNKEDNWWNSWGGDDLWADTKTWQNITPRGGEFNNNLYSFTKQGYDPWTGVGQYTPSSNAGFTKIIGDIDQWMAREFPWVNQWTDPYQVGANSTANIGGSWAQVDSWNTQILSAQQKVQAETGVFVPGNLIKSVMMLENGGIMQDDAGGAVGLMQVMPMWESTYGDLHDPANNIYAGVSILAGGYLDGEPGTGTDSWEWAAKRYIGLGGPDRFGTDANSYWSRIQGYMSELDSAVRTSGGGSQANAGASATGASVLSTAEKYVGVPYIWGAIPGKGEDPWQTGWDCSGFMYWLDQNYGQGNLPAGSHYQYQYAQQTGQLQTNYGGLMAGDMVFFDTGNTAGGGAELNRAGHVGIYLGGGQLLHAANPGEDTLISDMNSGYYRDRYIGSMHTAWSGGSSPGTTNSFDAITGGIIFPINQEIGNTDFSVGNADYDYGRKYGVSGHPGLDVGTPMNTNLYSPVGGTVVSDGGTGYYQDWTTGDAPHTGELMIQLDNGDQLILGHMNNITVKIGDRVSAGQSVGVSGWGGSPESGGGPHVHVEYRTPGANTESGYQVVDPRKALGGAFSGQFGTGVGQGKATYRPGANNWNQFMRSISRGEPVQGFESSAQTGFHNFLVHNMNGGFKTDPTTGKAVSGGTIANSWLSGGATGMDTWDKLKNNTIGNASGDTTIAKAQP